MFNWWGDTFLMIALAFAGVQAGAPLWGHFRKSPYLLALARPTALAQFFFIVCAYVCLSLAFVQNDFSIAYVVASSHQALPFWYRLTAVWGGHEGSLLLWALLLNAWTVFFSFVCPYRLLLALTLSFLGTISFGFLLFVLVASDPFWLNPGPHIGNDLNPLLQDPGFLIHPPLLYMGEVGFSVAFALAQAALCLKKLDHNWVKLTRQFALAAWCFLTAGILLGSWWAYRVLGWGGFWFWDPVENASLLPWFSATALLHVLVLNEKRHLCTHWAVILSLTTFAFVLLGTFLVRSGLLVSVHAFASSPERGLFLLMLCATIVALAVVIYVYRLPMLWSTPTKPILWASREMKLLISSALLFLAALVLVLGALYPLVLDAFGLGTISVGAPYFNIVMLPFAFLAMALMGWAPFCNWTAQPFTLLFQRTWRALAISVTSAFILLYWTKEQDGGASTAIGLGLCIWTILGAFYAKRVSISMSLGHLGFAMLLIGILLSVFLSEERTVRMRPGQAIALGPYQFFFLDTIGAEGANYRGARAHFEVIKNKRRVARLSPEKRIYTIRNMVTTHVAIHPGIFRDLYVALGDPLSRQDWSVRFYYKPFVRWIWGGGAVMIVGGILAIIKRKSAQYVR